MVCPERSPAVSIGNDSRGIGFGGQLARKPKSVNHYGQEGHEVDLSSYFSFRGTFYDTNEFYAARPQDDIIRPCSLRLSAMRVLRFVSCAAAPVLLYLRSSRLRSESGVLRLSLVLS